MQKHLTQHTINPRATQKLARVLARALRGGEVLALIGELGAGKTTFLKGLAKGLGVKQTITSPTFVLMKIYPVKRGRIRRLVHVDCYRLPAARLSLPKSGRHGGPGGELRHIGLEDYLGRPDTVVAIEWANKLKLKFPKVITISFQHGKSDNERIISW